jgi:hypothetical protein
MNISKIPVYTNDKRYHYIIIPDDLNTLLEMYSKIDIYSRDPYIFQNFYLWNLERDICTIANDDFDIHKKGMSYKLQQEQPHLNLQYFSKIWNNYDPSLCMNNVYTIWCQCLTPNKKDLILNRAMLKQYGLE